MTGNKERLDDFQAFQGGKVTFGGAEGKQHKASYKAINAVSSIFEPLQFPYMDLFGPTSIRSIDHKYYCLVITGDYSRFCWVFFLEHKDVTYPILRDFINLIENKLNKKVKAIRCDNGTEFKNAHMIELCRSKGIKREYSNARTPQQNMVAKRKNKTLIKAARTMLADSNHFKPFGCHVTILNTSDHLGKFDGKDNEGYIVGYSASNKAYMVYNVPNKRVEESINLKFLEEKPNVQGLDYEWSGKKATSDAESLGLGFVNDAGELQKNASAKTVPPGSIPVPTSYIPVPAGVTPPNWPASEYWVQGVLLYGSTTQDIY
nr:putative ribonuclease H-like domain-containing protein [Tanacetum cinerariifolium]